MLIDLLCNLVCSWGWSYHGLHMDKSLNWGQNYHGLCMDKSLNWGRNYHGFFTDKSLSLVSELVGEK